MDDGKEINAGAEEKRDNKSKRVYRLAVDIIIPLLAIAVPAMIALLDNSPKGNTVTDSEGISQQNVEGDGNTTGSVQSSGDDSINAGRDVNIYINELTEPDSSMGVGEQLSYSADLIDRCMYDDALEFLNECLTDESLDDETRAAMRFNRGICNYNLTNYNIAANDFRYAAEKSGNPDAYWNLAKTYMMSAKYSEASDAYGRAYDGIDDGDEQLSEKKQKILEEKKKADELAGELTRDGGM